MHFWTSRRVQFFLLAFLTIGIGVLPTLHPTVLSWEEHLGLSLLFHLRGERSAPPNVAVIAMDRRSTRQLGFSDHKDPWPREVHARLVNALSQAGAGVVAFDVDFEQAKKSPSDAQLAAAFEENGRIVLFARLDKTLLDSESGQVFANVQQLYPPLALFKDAAAAYGPFPLPSVPVRVSQYWPNFSGAGGIASLPLQALRVYLGQPQIHAMDTHSRYLNFYGGPRTLSTMAYHDVLRLAEEDPDQFQSTFSGRAVFVGYSARFQPGERDGFYTVFSTEDGLNVSGVEIAATAFSNLQYDDAILPLSRAQHFIVLCLWALLLSIMLLSVVLRWGSLRLGITAWGGTVALYSLGAWFLFIQSNFWVPLVVPILLQAPFALVLAILFQHAQVRQERFRIQAAFGRYLPPDVVARLATQSVDGRVESEEVVGVCMSTDAISYTSFSETMDTQALAASMNNYFERLFGPIRSRDGLISDVAGDAMLAFWPSPELNRTHLRQACEAALEIQSGEKHNAENTLKTRIGLHTGNVTLGTIGALDHFEYRVVGDTVNIASRVQGAAKSLGIQIAVSGAIATHADGFLFRALGVFKLEGKQQSIELYELLGSEGELESSDKKLCEDFKRALELCQNKQWQAALQGFNEISDWLPDDGPARFYIKQCQNNLDGNGLCEPVIALSK